MKVGSLFSGIGGLDLGLERAGMNVVWQVEKDPYAQKVLRKHWPHVGLFEDVRTIGASNLEPVDLICGGFPCQDVSIAGRGKGITGPRSGLWAEFARIVGEVRPEWVLIENVPALCNRGRGMGRVLQDLSSRGYDAEWDCIPAAALGAPHLRQRIFIVAHTNSYRRETFSAAPRPTPGTRYQDGGKAKTPSGWPNVEFVTGKPSRWTVEPDVGRVAHGVSKRVDRLRCLGNAVVPQVAEFVGRLILNADP